MIRTLQLHSGCRHVYLFDGHERLWYVCSRRDAPWESFGKIRPLDMILAESIENTESLVTTATLPVAQSWA